MATGELEFEAPLARFDVEEWTEYHENTSDEEESVGCHRNLPDNSPVANTALITAENESSSDSSNGTENFSETCSGSLEDLVNSFDQRVTKCCRNYEEQVEHLAPVQIRSHEEAHDSYQSWYTLTGTFGNLLPINWTPGFMFSHVKASSYSEDKDIDELDICDIEDDEELYCAVDENNEYAGDLCNLSADDNLEPVDNADDVINELESLFEDHDDSVTSADASHSLLSQLPSSALSPVEEGESAPINTSVWFEESIKKLSVPVLVQLSEDLARAVIEHNRTLRHELALNEDLKLENQSSRDFISVMLSIERKQQQLNQCHFDADDDGFNPSATGEGLYLSTVIPYRPSDGRPTIQRLQVYLTLLSAIDEDSSCVPRLLTDYILKVLCPAT